MRYHYEKPSIYLSMFGNVYTCDHPIYDRCTLYLIDDKGLAIVQQRFDVKSKTSWWGEIDPWLIDDLYTNPNFKSFFKSRAGECVNGLYPTITVRQLMWGLKMKPLTRERWETYFDRKEI